MTPKTPRELAIQEKRRNQPIEELERKADKARCKSNIWTAEELDYVTVQAEIFAKKLKGVWS
jgi:hypothetical protein